MRFQKIQTLVYLKKLLMRNSGIEIRKIQLSRNYSNGNGDGTNGNIEVWELPIARYLLATIIVPRNNNDNEMFPPQKIQGVIDFIVDLFDGATEYAPGTGYWKNKARGCDKDHVSVIQVVVPSTVKSINQLRNIAEALKEELDQDEILIFFSLVYFLADLQALSGRILWQRSDDESEPYAELIPA